MLVAVKVTIFFRKCSSPADLSNIYNSILIVGRGMPEVKTKEMSEQTILWSFFLLIFFNKITVTKGWL
jgi:hypothetical protein